jgi:CoA:oxalate CoA-transferase
MGRGQYALQSPWGPFATSDGYVIIAVLNAREWAALCGVIDRPDLAAHPELATGHQRSKAHETLVRPAVEAWTGARTRDEAVTALRGAGVPSAPVNTTEDLRTDPQVGARGMRQPTATRELGEIVTVGNPIKVASSLVGQGPASLPGLGEHTDEVLRERLGLDERAIAELREEKVVG